MYDEKYIELLIERCLNIKEKKSILISYDVINQEFVDKIVNYLEKYKIEIYLDKQDAYKKRDLINNNDIESLINNPYFDGSIWNEYALKDAAFLMISSEMPGVLDNVSLDKLNKVNNHKLSTKKIYHEKQRNNELNWLIAVYPNKIWAKDLFPELSIEDAYQKLYKLIMQATMADKENPIKEWNLLLDNQKVLINKLNNLKIDTLHYTNSLGTNLTIGLNPNTIWESAGSENDKIIVNMPSYEVFTSPNAFKTNGIVYASRPLMYNGILIKDFWVKFKNGKVIEYDAKEGRDTLENIINGYKNMDRLGECALVDIRTPITRMNQIFKETCLDENASCHLALGDGFIECLKDGNKYTRDELNEMGLNHSENHVDFMIGTDDMLIEAETTEGNITIFKDGKFNI